MAVARRSAVLVVIALVGLASCRTESQGLTEETATQATSTGATTAPSSTSTSTGPELRELRAWAAPFCEASVDLLLAWQESDEESDWLAIANIIDGTISHYREGLEAMDAPPFESGSWTEFVQQIEEEDVAADGARSEVLSMDPAEYADDPSEHPSVEVMLHVYFAIGYFMQQPPLNIGTSLAGPDGSNPGANYIPTCDELMELWFASWYGW